MQRKQEKTLPFLLFIALSMLSGLAMGGDTRKLINGQWALQFFGPVGAKLSLIPDTKITLQFHEDNKISGLSGCNRYAGIREEKANGTLSFKKVDTTLMLCSKPDGVMDQEKRYRNGLSRVSNFEITKNRLNLFDHNREYVLEFVHIPD